MKKIFILFGGLLLTGCGGNNDKDCNCSQQRYERKVVKKLEVPQTVVSSTDWEKKGNSEPISTDDCSKNGSISGSGNADSWLNPDNTTYTVVEYENRVSCQ